VFVLRFYFTVTRASKAWVAELIAAAGAEVTETYIDFFTSTNWNRNTRLAYARACYIELGTFRRSLAKVVLKKGKTPSGAAKARFREPAQ
jgi:hypothetical protein